MACCLSCLCMTGMRIQLLHNILVQSGDVDGCRQSAVLHSFKCRLVAAYLVWALCKFLNCCRRRCILLFGWEGSFGSTEPKEANAAAGRVAAVAVSPDFLGGSPAPAYPRSLAAGAACKPASCASANKKPQGNLNAGSFGGGLPRFGLPEGVARPDVPGCPRELAQPILCAGVFQVSRPLFEAPPRALHLCTSSAGRKRRALDKRVQKAQVLSQDSGELKASNQRA